MNEPDALRALGALAQETRLKIFRLLVVAGPAGLTPSLMAEALGDFAKLPLGAAALARTDQSGEGLSGLVN